MGDVGSNLSAEPGEPDESRQAEERQTRERQTRERQTRDRQTEERQTREHRTREPRSRSESLAVSPLFSQVSATKGGDFYSSNAAPQASSVERAVSLLDDALGVLSPFDVDGEPVVVVDYGCAAGRSAMRPMSRVIQAVRRSAPNRPVMVVHNDVPANDFSALFTTIEGAFGSYRNAEGPIFTMATGRSFFDAVLPQGYVTIGWSSHAAHWLRAAPGTLGAEHVFALMAPTPQREPWKQQAADDWRAFWESRAVELRPSGQVIVTVGAVDDEGHAGSEPLYHAADQAIAAMVSQSLLSPIEAESMVLPTYCRTERELRQPFDDPWLGRLVRLEDLAIHYVEDPFWADYEATADAGRFGQSWSMVLRAFSENMFFHTGLLARRDPSERRTLADAFYDLVAEYVAVDPGGARNRWCVAILRVSRSLL